MNLLYIWQQEILPVLKKEIIHILNDSTTLRFAIIIPVFQLLIFGMAINTEVRDIPTFVLDYSRSNASHELIDRLEATTYFEVVEYASSRDELDNAIKRGDADIAVIIPPDYALDLVNGRSIQVQALIDGSDSTVATQAQGALVQLGNTISQEIRFEGISENARGRPALEIIPRYLFNPDLKTNFLILPGLLGVVIYVVVAFLCSLSIVREKEGGTLEQLLVTPLSSLGLVAGKIIPYFLIGLIDFNIVVFAMYAGFNIPIAGSLLVLELAAAFFIIAVLAISLIVSIISTTQAQATQFIGMSMLPSILLSGYIFPFDSMPWPFQVIGYLHPVTHFIEISRGVILRGADVFDLMGTFMLLSLYALALFIGSVMLASRSLKV